MTILLNRFMTTRISISRQLFTPNHMRSTALHQTTTPSTPSKYTPKIYLEDKYVVKESGGITEEEGAGGKNPGVAEEYVLAGTPESEVGYGVPGGPYHTANPLEEPRRTGKPATGEFSSTSPDYAHPLLTKKAERVKDGDASGQVLQGSDGGIHVSAKVQTTKNTLGERNPQPRPKFGEGTGGEMEKK